MKNATNRIWGILGRLILLTLLAGLVLRIVLLFNEQTLSLDFTALEWITIYLIGAVNDLCVALLAGLPLWLWMVTTTDRKYRSPWGWITLSVLVAALCYVLFFDSIFSQYSGAARRIATAMLAYWAGSYALRLFIPRIRPYWTRMWFFLLTMIYVGAILFNVVSEYLFWNEFGVRYNFIAVDYLVYTHEVIGNIVESYPIFPILAGWLVLTLVVRELFFRSYLQSEQLFYAAGWRKYVATLYPLLVIAAVGLLQLTTPLQQGKNTYANELQANGLQRFYDAFRKNELDYRQFYPTRPEQEVSDYLCRVYGSEQGVLRTVQGIAPQEPTAKPYNIVLITLESMSASYMAHFGNTKQLTPTLDSLYTCGLAFDRLYATGNRTVRGLEAVTLSMPPCPGQSIIKRQDNTSCTTIGELLAAKGYDVTYFYGGNSYFDNMRSFFGGNGYRIIDQTTYTDEEITFANIWGVCDEDCYRKAVRTLDTLATTSRPVFAHIMSVSNHRPFTYPAGRISIPHDSRSREGGVMYSDYALGEFMRAARQTDWFDRTIFLITADHCASSAGAVDIPLDKYHIPAVIVAPGLVEPRIESRIVSQIDLMPTLLSLIGMSYESPFYGRSILEPDFTERAFVATYQDLGYIEGDRLTILSPVRRVAQYRLTPTAEDPHRMEAVQQIDSLALQHAIAYYQGSN